jgi:hypothetical protein
MAERSNASSAIGDLFLYCGELRAGVEGRLGRCCWWCFESSGFWFSLDVDAEAEGGAEG